MQGLSSQQFNPIFFPRFLVEVEDSNIICLIYKKSFVRIMMKFDRSDVMILEKTKGDV